MRDFDKICEPHEWDVSDLRAGRITMDKPTSLRSRVIVVCIDRNQAVEGVHREAGLLFVARAENE